MNSTFELFSSIVMIIILVIIGILIIVTIVDLLVNGQETPKGGWKHYLYKMDLLGCLLWHRHEKGVNNTGNTMSGGHDGQGFYKLFGGKCKGGCGDYQSGGCGDGQNGGCGDKLGSYGGCGGSCSSSSLTYDPKSFLQ